MAIAEVNGAAAVDSRTAAGEPAVVPGWGYYVGAAVALIAGGIVGTRLFEHLQTTIKFTPPKGIGAFALFYVIAQVIERLQEPFAPFLGTATSEGDGGGVEGGGGPTQQLPSGRKNQRQARALLEKTQAEAAVAAPANAQGAARKVANAKRTVDQVRANLRVLLFGTSAMLGMLMAGYLKAGFLQAVGVTGSETWFDIVVTGVIVGGGTKVVHDIISNIQESKEQKQDTATSTT